MSAIETRADVSAGPVASGAPDDTAAATASPDALASATSSATLFVTPGREIGGRDGPEPTRYGDWEKNGRCIDF